MWIVVAGWLASLLVFSAFFMKTMLPLRLTAIASNVAFITYTLLGLRYGIFGRLYPILVLHACLLPLNLVRLRQLNRLVEASQGASNREAIQALIPYMKPRSYAAGDVVFTRGDRADTLYVIQHGVLVFPETGKRVSAGAVFGEVGLFAPQGVRSLSAVCESDCRLAEISKEKALELYYQNPSFGMFLIRLVAGFLLEGNLPAASGIGATPRPA
jgi:CRP/FNR family transcriptional regulator, cyclic AMP receptor protein